MDVFTGHLKITKFKWQTESKAPNCGVFVMRHMETYMGEQFEKYQCDAKASCIAKQIKEQVRRQDFAVSMQFTVCKNPCMMNGK